MTRQVERNHSRYWLPWLLFPRPIQQITQMRQPPVSSDPTKGLPTSCPSLKLPPNTTLHRPSCSIIPSPASSIPSTSPIPPSTPFRRYRFSFTSCVPSSHPLPFPVPTRFTSPFTPSSPLAGPSPQIVPRWPLVLHGRYARRNRRDMFNARNGGQHGLQWPRITLPHILFFRRVDAVL